MTELIKLQQSFAIAEASGSPNFLMSIGEAKTAFGEIDRLRANEAKLKAVALEVATEFDSVIDQAAGGGVKVDAFWLEQCVDKLRETAK